MFEVLDGLRVQVAAGRHDVEEVFGSLERAKVCRVVCADVVPAEGLAPGGVPIETDIAAADQECATCGVGKQNELGVGTARVGDRRYQVVDVDMTQA